MGLLSENGNFLTKVVIYDVFYSCRLCFEENQAKLMLTQVYFPNLAIFLKDAVHRTILLINRFTRRIPKVRRALTFEISEALSFG